MLATSDLDVLLSHADSQQETVIRAAARAAGLLWLCRNTACRRDNPRSARTCGSCGCGKNGKPVGDIFPSPYGASPRRWRALRKAITQWCTEHNRPLPDGVTFAYWGDRDEDCGWAAAAPSFHYGGQQVAAPELACDEAVSEALNGLNHHSAPSYGGDMRIAVHR
ncbi:hypothetical protein [Streptomyces luteireticuli]|uniref:hypothetical protein n=1 Tax=Streptomyces luteireticuli TaxID=173858 RepID=UPI0035571F60